MLKRFDNRPENALRLHGADTLKARTKECVGSRLVYIYKPAFGPYSSQSPCIASLTRQGRLV